MGKANAKALTLNIDIDLLDRVDKYRFKRMFASRTEAIEFLLDYALKQNPERSGEPTKKSRAGKAD